MVGMLGGEGGWSVSFAGCGFLGVYHIGAATCLQERAPRIIRDARQICGASAGALTGAVLVGGGSLVEACADVLALAREARKRNLGPLHPSFNVMKIIRDGLCKNLPENTHELISGKLSISLTRVSDGKNVLVSNFNSKEEVIQALLCSSFVPIYCGLIPPSFRGVRYVDGGISDNLPQHDSRNTITISPFTGESDICPKGNSANFHEMNLTNTSIQFSLGNIYRLTQALFPPEPKVLGEICEQGYSDALRFLKENGLLHDSVSFDLALTKEDRQVVAQTPAYTDKKIVVANQAKKEMQDEKMLIDQLKLAAWPLDGTIFENLPPRLRKVESAYFVALRLVDWFPDIPDDVRWMQGQLCQVVGTIYSKARKRLLCIPSKENSTLLRKCQTAPLNTNLHFSYCSVKMPHSSTHLEEWLLDLPCRKDLVKKEVEVGINESFDSICPFFIHSEESGVDFDSSSEKSFQTASED
ncbi:patatin-like phospholipase domain-containing protein 2 isoform X2 [Rhineura floridana]|uniref:patatin-like phospholipase domain-containing protein 2 isoform X2 n=1 Tax=Rhineura floridana TaxID=261503 RepID=UPI002AC873BB|nr:patatin-like phospholipase domain-containing protein 2 isoform X2 [Rhineura floridana]